MAPRRKRFKVKLLDMHMAVLQALILLLIFTCTVHGQCDNENPRALRGGDTFVQPPVLRSVDGMLDIVLTVEMAQVQFEWLCIQRRTYNGSIPGPTWIIKPGDTVRVKLINKLTKTSEETRRRNKMRKQNVTNLHTHGLHVSSESPQDNIFTEVNPGEEYQYEYDIDEENSPGTYWYHAHLHGSTMFQVTSGLAGLLIVEDPLTGAMAINQHLADISCPNNCQHDVAFLFQPVLQYTNETSVKRGFVQIQERIEDSFYHRSIENTTFGIPLYQWLTDPANGIDHFTTNGILFPRLSMRSGQRKRFRLVHGGGDRTLELLITEQNGETATDACEVYEIAFDGIYLDEARKPRLGKSFLVPASKVDWIVVCNRPGTYELRSVTDPLDSCSIGEFVRRNAFLVTIVVTGSSTTPTLQDKSLPKRSSISGDFRHIHESQVAGKFVIEANARQHLNREQLKSHDHYRFRAQVGTVQEWYLTNSDPGFGHPMHIHVNNFQIISYNNYTGPVSFGVNSANSSPNASKIVFYSQTGDICLHQSEGYEDGATGNFSLPQASENGVCGKGEQVNHMERAQLGGPGTLGYVQPGEFRDVILVPPLANITIRFLAHRFTGEVVIHCHILVHEDIGMMMTVKIEKEGADLNANVTSGNGTPGKCSGSSLQFSAFLLFSSALLSFVGHFLTRP